MKNILMKYCLELLMQRISLTYYDGYPYYDHHADRGVSYDCDAIFEAHAQAIEFEIQYFNSNSGI
jgi:hypothetical protein